MSLSPSLLASSCVTTSQLRALCAAREKETWRDSLVILCVVWLLEFKHMYHGKPTRLQSAHLNVDAALSLYGNLS